MYPESLDILALTSELANVPNAISDLNIIEEMKYSQKPECAVLWAQTHHLNTLRSK